MKIGIATVQIPFIRGGAEILAESLCAELIKRKIQATIISIPFKWYPPEHILDNMLISRLIDVTEVNGQNIDLLITLKFPAYYFIHPNKIAWLLHQHRQAYDLYGTPHGDLHQTEQGQRVANEIQRWDKVLLPEHRHLYTISKKVTDRLLAYTHLHSTPLYPPPNNPECFQCHDYEPFILAPGRLDALKRQHLIIESMPMIPKDIRLVLIGNADSEYGTQVNHMINHLGLKDRVLIRGQVSEDEKIDLYSRCLCVYNGVYDEDYGYLTIEGFLSSKPVLTHTDSGGPLEFVIHGRNGFITEPDPSQIADCVTQLYSKHGLAKDMGNTARNDILSMNMTWDDIIGKLLS
ncbi:MAG: glycosyltransferase family 4 protein [Desulfobacterales bacterium]|nr:glycosyltransferase family 4 protein [Desulfobacterales bacterium]